MNFEMGAFDEIITYPPFATVVIGIILSYFFINRYERSKDKIKIKEKLVLKIIEAWNINSQKLLLLSYSISDESLVDLSKHLAKQNKAMGSARGLIKIYIQKDSTVKSLLKQLDQIIQINDELTLRKPIVNHSMISRDEYIDLMSKSNKIYDKILDIIRDAKVSYKA